MKLNLFLKLVRKPWSMSQNSVSFGHALGKSSLKAAFSCKSKVAFPKTEVFGKPHLICRVSLLVLLCLLSLVPAEAQQRRLDPWWLTLEEGKRYFRNGAYGDALRFFEQAREDRKNYFAKMERDLITVLSIREVRRFDDDLGLLETYIERNFRTDAANALKELYYRIPKESFDNSSAAALTELGRLKSYPEAEYWIGEVYRVEGELAIALGQYQKAYNERALLENPGFETEILYKIADLRQLRREHTEMLKTLEDILKADTLWSRESFTRANMVRSLENNGINRFLLLFRHNSPAMEKAHRTMGFYYYSNNRHDRAAEHLLFAFLIQNSVIIDALLQSQYDYSFSTLPALFADIARRRDLLAYMDQTEYFKTLYFLANSLYGVSRRTSAREIWVILRDNASGEWQNRAAAQLRNPQLDQIPAQTIGRTGAR
jgi:tetratricopeptide (TPR) repeat protein